VCAYSARGRRGAKEGVLPTSLVWRLADTSLRENQEKTADSFGELSDVLPYVQHKSVPQRLKPSYLTMGDGTAEPVPFVQRRFSLQLFRSRPEPVVCAECASRG
jgi:hypothetical protein